MIKRFIPCLLFFFVSSPIFAGGWGFHLISSIKARNFLESNLLKHQALKYKTQILNGSIYPDSAFTIHQYKMAQWMHESEFINGFFDTLEKDKCQSLAEESCLERFYFILGCIAHIVSDQNFDSLFLTQLAKEDFDNNLSKAQDFSDIPFDTVIIKEYEMTSWVPKLYQPHNSLLKVLKNHKNTISYKTLKTMQTQQSIRYAALTVYADVAADRIKKISPWASEHFQKSPGGVLDTAKKIAAFWDQIWEEYLRNDRQKFPRFVSRGRWPHDSIEIISYN